MSWENINPAVRLENHGHSFFLNPVISKSAQFKMNKNINFILYYFDKDFSEILLYTCHFDGCTPGFHSVLKFKTCTTQDFNPGASQEKNPAPPVLELFVYKHVYILVVTECKVLGQI